MKPQGSTQVRTAFCSIRASFFSRAPRQDKRTPAPHSGVLENLGCFLMGLGSQTQLGGESLALVRNAKKSRKIWAKHPRVRTRFRTRGFVPGRITEGRSPAPRSGAIKFPSCFTRAPNPCREWAKNRDRTPGSNPYFFAVGEIFSRAQGERKVSSAA